MRLVKRQSKQTYQDKNKQTKHYYNYFLELDNKKRIQIKPSFVDDKRTLDAVAEYEPSKPNEK